MRRVAVVCALFVLAACGGTQAHASMSYGDSARELYENAMHDVRSENCLAAEPVLRRVRREYAYSRYAPLAELRLGDCLMIEKKWQEAISAFRTFQRTRPQHEQVPYAAFKVAECYYRQIPGDTIFQPPAEERDQSSTHSALRQLRRFVLDFPDDTARVTQAEHMEIEALTLLAKHELYVANFYLDHDHPDAAIERLRTLLAAYSGSTIEPQAMLLLGRVLLRMQRVPEARQVFALLDQRHPHSGYAAQARGYLHEIPAPPRAAAPAAAPAAPEEPLDEPAAPPATPATPPEE